jgi:hypothetical protein
MSLHRICLGVICAVVGLGTGVWLIAVILSTPPDALVAKCIWPIALDVVLALYGGWCFVGAWWVIALLCGFPSLLFCCGWFGVFADEGAHKYPLLVAGFGCAVLVTGASWLSSRLAGARGGRGAAPALAPRQTQMPPGDGQGVP